MIKLVASAASTIRVELLDERDQPEDLTGFDATGTLKVYTDLTKAAVKTFATGSRSGNALTFALAAGDLNLAPGIYICRAIVHDTADRYSQPFYVEVTP